MSTKAKGKGADTQAAGGAITLTPTEAVAGSGDVALTVTAADGDLAADAVVVADGADLVTVFVDASTVTATLPGAPAASVVSVHVRDTVGDTADAEFTFTAAPEPSEPPASVPDEVLEAQLRAWGLSGEPVSWAFDQWQPAIVAIRAANLGFGEVATAQGMLDTLFPLNTLDATKVCVDGSAAANAEVSEKTTDGVTTLSTKAKGVDPAAFSWFVDGTRVGSGPEAEAALTPGEHLVEVQIAIAGTVFSHRKEITV